MTHERSLILEHVVTGHPMTSACALGDTLPEVPSAALLDVGVMVGIPTYACITCNLEDMKPNHTLWWSPVRPRGDERCRLPVGWVREQGQGCVFTEHPASCPKQGWHSMGSSIETCYAGLTVTFSF